MSTQAYLEFQTENGPVFVEVEATPSMRGGGEVAAGRFGDSVGGAAVRTQETFAQAIAGIRPIAKAALEQVAALRPNEAKVEFGVKLSGKAGVILSSVAGEAHIKITLTWKNDSGPKPT